MTIEYSNYDSDKGTKTVMTECPACDVGIPEGIGFAEHWRKNCPVNEEAS